MANTTVNKVVLGNETLIDLTPVTVTADKLASGYTALDASGALITGTASGDSKFIVTVSYNDQTEMWEPDCTYAEVSAAYNAGKDISVKSDDSAVTVDGYYEDTENTFIYVLYNSLDYPIRFQQYEYSNSGLSMTDDQEIVGKLFTSPSVSYTPTESTQTDTVTYDPLYYSGIEQVSVTVNPISNTYVGSGITQRSSTDLTASGATVTVPAGYYSAQASKSVASGSAGTPTATKGTVSNNAVSVTPSVTNTTGYITGGTKTGTAVTVSASELVSGTKSITASGTTDVTNYASASVASGGATASATKGSVSNHSVTVTPSVTRTAGYITAGSANGTAVTVSASELVSGTYTVNSSGTKDVTNYASASVAAGSVTASASKSVRNNVATVTPSETRTAGWVTAGSTNGTAVTVSASELVSGSETKTANGTYDVTNLASLVVAVPYSTIYSGTLSPSSSQGSNGDVYLKTVS